MIWDRPLRQENTRPARVLPPDDRYLGQVMTAHLGNGNVPSALNWNRHCGVQGLLHLLHLNLYILVKFVLVIAFETGAALQTIVHARRERLSTLTPESTQS